MGVKVRIKDNKVWLRIDHRGTRKSHCLGENTKALRKTAHEAAADIAAKLRLGDLSALQPHRDDGPATSPTFRAVAAEWLLTRQQDGGRTPRRASTVENYSSVLDFRLLPQFGDRRIAAISHTDVEDWIAEARTTPHPTSGKVVAYSTLIGHYLPTLSQIFTYAVKRGWIAANPVDRVEFEASDDDKAARAKANPFTPAEMVEVIGAATQIDPTFGLFIRTWSQLGARSGEIRALQVKDLDLKAGTVSIEKTLLPDETLGLTKNHWSNGKRVASLLDAVANDRKPEALLKDLAAHVRGKQPGDFVFTKPSGGPITNGSLKERWPRALDLTGLAKREPEQIRHSYGSEMANRPGAVYAQIAAQIGNTVATLLKHYVKAHAPATIRKSSATGGRRAA